ncbi:MAG: RnfH family protein [Simplicispira suum]|uniref:RnfH family protein n=1 Tax=Simplicispira suum TaxID=2109915 RepID=UPI001C6C2DF3|nr:RnfH family protein [Simplicispira suum]MBW7831765.1 RnfH family protein [Simplicispira suum]
MADAQAPAGKLRISVWACTGPGAVREWAGDLPAGARVIDALNACGGADREAGGVAGVWGRVVPLGHGLRDGDRVEIYRALTVDPKVARRERFVQQGRRGAGLFARGR